MAVRERNCDGLPDAERLSCLVQCGLGVISHWFDMFSPRISTTSSGRGDLVLSVTRGSLADFFSVVPWLSRENKAAPLPPEPNDVFDALSRFAVTSGGGSRAIQIKGSGKQQSMRLQVIDVDLVEIAISYD